MMLAVQAAAIAGETEYAGSAQRGGKWQPCFTSLYIWIVALNMMKRAGRI